LLDLLEDAGGGGHGIYPRRTTPEIVTDRMGRTHGKKGVT
jgi:hypothetical protein